MLQIIKSHSKHEILQTIKDWCHFTCRVTGIAHCILDKMYAVRKIILMVIYSGSNYSFYFMLIYFHKG